MPSLHAEKQFIPKVGQSCGQRKDDNNACTAPWQYIVQHGSENETRMVCCGKHLTSAIDRLTENNGDAWGYVRVRTKLVDFG